MYLLKNINYRNELSYASEYSQFVKEYQKASHLILNFTILILHVTLRRFDKVIINTIFISKLIHLHITKSLMNEFN